jgi:hypothetical protein
MKTLILILCAIGICFGAYAATGTHAGVWTAELQDDKLQITIFHREHDTAEGARRFNNQMGFDVRLAELAGVSSSELRSDAANVKFMLTREAGSITFDGRFSNGNGAGQFDFRPSDAFVRTLGSLGFSEFRHDELLIFAVNDLTTETVRGLQSLGYHPTNHELVDIAIFNITPDAVREYARLGWENLPIRELVELRIGHIDAAWVKAMRDLGFTGLTSREASNAGILGVTPAYVREMRAAGLESTSLHQLTDLRVGHITPKRIEEYTHAGYPHLSARELSELGVQGVTPQYIEELRAAGYDHLTVHQLINAKIFGVTPEYIRKMNAAGYSAIPLEKLVQLRMAGMGDLVTKRGQ